MSQIIIDIGSGNIKAYKVDNQNIKSIYLRNIEFKKHFSIEQGIDPNDLDILINSILEIQKENSKSTIWAGATSIFRMLSDSQRNYIQSEVLKKTNIIINIISKEQEAIYMAKAVGNIKELNEPYLVCCVGGSSTEMSVWKNGEIIEHLTLEFATGDMLKKFPNIANDITDVNINDMYDYIQNNFKIFPKTKCRFAIFTGFHLIYNQVAQNKMHDNIFFNNENIPYYLTVEEFDTNNINAIKYLNLQTLKERYKENPNFMNGTRGCHTIVSYILKQIGAKYYFPTNLNMIHGIVNDLNEKQMNKSK